MNEGSTQFNPGLLTLVRERSGLSQGDLGKVAGMNLKQATISKYESGIATPSAEVIEKFASFFGYLPAFFFQSSELVVDGLVYHRKRASLPSRKRGQIEAEARLRALDALYLCRECGIHSDLLPREGRTPLGMANDLRKYWNIPAGPLENVFNLLEEHGIVILEFDFKTDLLDGFFMSLSGDVVCLAVNSNPAFPPDRRRFSVLHELGHALLSSDMFPGKEAEVEANMFAAEFLAPAEDIRKELNPPINLQRLYSLKATWGMSMAAILRRAKDIGRCSDAQYRRACIFMNSKGFRKKEPLCGVLDEKCSLLSNMFRTVFHGVKQPWERFYMLRSTFDERYGKILEEDMNKIT